MSWCVNHRVHHKYVDTDADPHNSRRGFFFCHIAWFALYPNSECLKKTEKIPKDDLLNDPVVYWQT